MCVNTGIQIIVDYFLYPAVDSAAMKTELIVNDFGGAPYLAAFLGVNRQAVYKWDWQADLPGDRAWQLMRNFKRLPDATQKRITREIEKSTGCKLSPPAPQGAL